jgi:hypothetical protein
VHKALSDGHGNMVMLTNTIPSPLDEPVLSELADNSRVSSRAEDARRSSAAVHSGKEIIGDFVPTERA